MKRSPWRTINLLMLAVFGLGTILYATGAYTPKTEVVTREAQRQSATTLIAVVFGVGLAVYFLAPLLFDAFSKKKTSVNDDRWHTLGSTVESVAEEEERLRNEA